MSPSFCSPTAISTAASAAPTPATPSNACSPPGTSCRSSTKTIPSRWKNCSFGDNDRLSAEVATLAGADLLIILTQVDGLLDKDGNVIRLVRDIDRVKKLARQSKGRFAVGGMISKLEAVKMAVDAGITTVIINGRRPAPDRGRDRAAKKGGDALPPKSRNPRA